MKTVFRFLNMGMLLAAVTVAGATYSFAQDPCSDTASQDKLQETIRGAYAKDKPTAITAGKQLLEKYGSCEYSKDFVTWLNAQMPKWEQIVKDQAQMAVLSDILKRYDSGIQNKNYDQAYAAGDELLAKFPNREGNLNQILPLGMIGLYQSYPPTKNYKYNDQSIKYADIAIGRLKSGEKATKPNGKYGVFEFEMTKEDALSELGYAKAYITYWAKGDKKGAMPLYYESLQMPGRHKDDPYSYATIGGYYADEAARLGKEYAELVKTQAPAATDAPEVAADKDAKLKAAEGILKGYLDRAIDAYSRAWKNTTDKTAKDNLYKTVGDLYKLRYQKADGLDTFIATTTAKPMPNPTTEVTPVVEAEPTTNTTTTSTGTPASAKPTATPTKPVSTTTTAKVSADQTGVVTKSDAAPSTAKPAAAKKATVKKGTR